MPDKAYCLKCRKHVTVNNGKWSVNANGTPNLKGVCSQCGTTVSALVAAKNAPADIQRKAEAAKKSMPSKRKTKKSKSKSGGRAARKTHSKSRGKK